ncbi:MAG: 2-amino-4-hydroxy-6-hydroxymethyldihydropteridine diphosphokinase [Rhodobacteraceae bacterium]|nr:2-amino-4-hydroxy-6-hydroxymethyldihydropteridine diphosphokinase [Paracoccaceae bacterium]
MPIMYAKLDKMYCHDCIVAIGSNQRLTNSSSSDVLSTALSRIAVSVGSVTSLSRFFQTPAFPKGSGPDFVNAALVVRAQGSADEILEKLHAIEHELGRVRETRWGQRTIDIDLVAVEQKIIPNRARSINFAPSSNAGPCIRFGTYDGDLSRLGSPSYPKIRFPNV